MQYLEILKKWWTDASSLARALVVTGVLAIVLTSTYFGSQDPTYHWVPLNQTPMSLAEAGRLTAKVAGMNIPFRTVTEAGGQTVLVPLERSTEASMALAVDGDHPGQQSSPFDTMWKDGAPAFQTASMERAMRVHAKEKSIERKLTSLQPVRRAMVDLALPDQSILTKTEHEPSASVVVELHPGFAFTRQLAGSVKSAVAHAVEGLAVDRVALIDHLGRRVGPEAGDEGTALASRALALRQEHEARYENRVIELLEPIIGRGRVVARVSAEMDMSRVEQRLEEFDPDNAVVRRERKSTDSASTEETDGALGTGVKANTPQPGAGDRSKSRTRNDNTVSERDYAVPRKIVETTRPMGELQRISVAVIVDSAQPEAPAGDGEGVTVKAKDVEVTAARTIPSERALAEIVKKAVGFDPRRGDSIEILFAPFDRPKFPADAVVAPEPIAESAALPPWLPFTAVVVVGFGAVVMSLMLTEKKRRREAEEAEAAAKKREAQERKKAEEAAADAAEKAKKSGQNPLREEVREISSSNTPATVALLKDWLRGAAET